MKLNSDRIFCRPQTSHKLQILKIIVLTQDKKLANIEIVFRRTGGNSNILFRTSVANTQSETF
jgi:hypothetical protein